MHARILYTNKMLNALFFGGMKGTFCKILDHLMVTRQITNNVHGNVFFFFHFITHLSYTGCDVSVKITNTAVLS